MSAQNNTTSAIHQQNTISLMDIWSISLSHWKWYAISVFVCVSVATLYLLCTPRHYTRQASVMIKQESKSHSVMQLGELGGDLGFTSTSSVDNELVAIQSPSIMLEVIKRMHLDYTYQIEGFFLNTTLYGKTLPISSEVIGLADNQVASFKMLLDNRTVTLRDFKSSADGVQVEDDNTLAQGQVGDSIQTPLGTIVVLPTSYFTEGQNMEILVVRNNYQVKLAGLKNSLVIDLNDKRSSIINISCTDVNIQRAEDIINTLIMVYNESWVKDKNQVAVSTSEFINDRLNVIENELGNVDTDISKFKSNHLLPNVSEVSSMAMSEMAASSASIRSLNTRLYMARYVKNYVQRGDAGFQLLPVNSGIENSSIEQQISSYNEMVLRRNSLVANSSETNPLVLELNNKLTELRGSIVIGLDNLITNLNEQVRAEQRNVDITTSRIAQSPLQAKDLLSVERQQKVKESLYLFLLQKREENELNQAFSAYNTRIVTPPMGSNVPTSPNSKKILGIAFLIGLALPFAVIYLKETLNTKVRGRKDLEKLASPFIGEIPLYKSRKKIDKNVPEYRLLVKARSRSIINEAFRVVRTNIEFMTNSFDKHTRVFIITSANPGSGKTFLLGNIAASFEIKDKKVIGVDLDLRRSSFSEFVGKPDKGITDYLTGQVAECPKYKVEGHPGFEIIPVGTVPPNPTELISSPKLQKLIDKLKEEYDYVFLDCPPIDIVADTTIIAPWADMTLFVVRAGLMERDMLPRIDAFYKEKRFENMALLLNGTISGHGSYGYGYGSYGYGGSKKDYYGNEE